MTARAKAGSRPGGAADTAPEPSAAANWVKGLRGQALIGAAGLAVAVGAGGWLLAAPSPSSPTVGGGPSARPTVSSVPQIWPRAARTQGQLGILPDDTTYLPKLYVSTELSVGTALTADGGSLRLMRRAADGAATELRRARVAADARFEAFAVAGDALVWAESRAGGQAGDPYTEIWTANWRTRGAPVKLTADTAHAIFRETATDIVIAEGKAHWIAGASATAATAEVRSVPLTGGRVTARRVPGKMRLSTWPWLTSAESGVSVPAVLYNLRTGAQTKVVSSPTQAIMCTLAWCRVSVRGATDVIRLEVQKPDGSARQRIGGREFATVINDVALVDRFEALGEHIDDDAVARGVIRLSLFDTRTGRVVTVADEVLAVDYAAGILFWSTAGKNTDATWHALDLRTLTP